MFSLHRLEVRAVVLERVAENYRVFDAQGQRRVQAECAGGRTVDIDTCAHEPSVDALHVFAVKRELSAVPTNVRNKASFLTHSVKFNLKE